METPSEIERIIEYDISVSIHSIESDVAVSNNQLNRVREATSADPQLTDLRRMMINGFPTHTSQLSPELKSYQKFASDLYEGDGVTYHNSNVVIPSSLRREMVDSIHKGHMGMDKCKSLARQSLYRPNMSRDIENMVAKYTICNAYCNAQPRKPLLPHEMPARPW